MKEKIIQFGEGNFLRGFVDYFVHKMNEQNLFNGSVVIVQPIAKGLGDVINEQHGKYNLYLRGIENGEEKCEHTLVESVSRAINPYEDFNAFLELAHNPDMRFIVSNTTEAGIEYVDSCKKTDAPPQSYPAKLTLLLLERFNQNLPGFIIFSCELIDKNADKLKECVLKYADLWSLGEDFKSWVISENSFCNTLVDRIVTGYPRDEAEKLCRELGYTDKLLDTAEIFHLWVIEGNFENKFPLKTAGYNVVWTDDVTPYKKRKVRVLNGSHTSMVCAALLAGVETVKGCLDDEEINAYLKKCLFTEILPILGDNESNRAFAAAVLERFQNPFIRHQLMSIVLNCVSKYTARVLPTVKEYYEKNGAYPEGLSFSLAALIEFYRKGAPNDAEDIIELIKNSPLDVILSSQKLWGEDLSHMYDIVKKHLNNIEKLGVREAMQCIL